MSNEFLPTSTPITALALLSFCDMACSLTLQLFCHFLSLPGLEQAGSSHYQTRPRIELGAGFDDRSKSAIGRSPRRPLAPRRVGTLGRVRRKGRPELCIQHLMRGRFGWY